MDLYGGLLRGWTMKRISLLGSTGSIGKQCLDLVQRLPNELQVVGLAAGRSLERLAQQARTHRPQVVACARPEDLKRLKVLIDDPSISVLAGAEGQQAVASLSDADTVVAAVVGFSGLTGALAAARAGKNIALANKESLVAAGALLTETARRHGATLIPVDSEHAALHQCLLGESKQGIHRLWLTASGGPFRGCKRADLERITVEEALNHPNWSMGPKITVDSASLMNKGLELIEAAWLFDVAPQEIEIVVHPPSLVHSMVEFVDGTFKAQLGAPDMRAAIAYALATPDRYPLLACDGVQPWSPFNQNLEFEGYDRALFRAPDLCRDALQAGGGTPAALNAINEVLVARFLDRELSFLHLIDTLAHGLEAMIPRQLASDTLEAVQHADQEGRQWAAQI